MAEYKSRFTGAEIDNAVENVSNKQDILVSGENIKTINNQSILGNGNININNKIYNVKDYGAVGDGITDDTKAFEDCIREANGDLIIVPKGTYVVNGCTPVPSSGSIAINMIGIDRPKLIRTVVKDPNPTVANDRSMFMFYGTKQAYIYGIDFDSQRDNFISETGSKNEYVDITNDIEIKGTYYFYKDSGKRITSSADYEGALIPVEAGDKFKITARTTSANYLVQFYSDFQYNGDPTTAVGDVVTLLPGVSPYGTPSTNYKDEEITIPEGCKFIGVNSYIRQGSPEYTNLQVKKLEKIQSYEWLGTAILYFYNGGANIDIDNCSFENTSREGVFCKGNFENVCIHNCKFNYVSANFWSRLGNLKNFTFENNVSHNSRTMAVELDNENGYRVDNVFIRNNKFTDIVKCAIFLRNTHHAVIENNYYDYFDTKTKEYSPYAGVINAAPYFVWVSTDDNEIIDLERDYTEDIVIRGNRGHAERSFAIFPNPATKKADGTILGDGDSVFKNIEIYDNNFNSNYALIRVKCVDNLLARNNYEHGTCDYGFVWKEASNNIIAYDNIINGKLASDYNFLKNYQDCSVENGTLNINNYIFCDLCKLTLQENAECTNINAIKLTGKEIKLYVRYNNLTFKAGDTISEDYTVNANSFVKLNYFNGKWYFSK